MRLFVAIDLPDAQRDALATVQGDLAAGRAMDPETFHLTLAFLGELDEEQAEEMHLALGSIRAAPFDLTISGLETFGGATPAVAVAGVADPGPVTALHRQVRGAARQAGIVLSRERFRPHVTLARFRKRMEPGEAEALRLFLARNAAMRLEPFTVEGFGLYRSTRTSEGALHEALALYPLG
ncbi:MAG: RNA 2',3'-cyclic phosphodiesterase [Pseudooceanicola sp.]